MRRRALLARTSTALLVATVGLAGCSGTPIRGPDASSTGSPSTDPTPTPATIRTAESLAVEVTDHELVRRHAGTEDELVAVTGALENAGESAVTDLQIVASFVGDGEVLGESTVETGELAAGDQWEFEVTLGESGSEARAVSEYRLLVRQRG